MKQFSIECDPSPSYNATEGGSGSLASDIDRRLSELLDKEDVPNEVKAPMLMSHFLARWAWRTWEFAVALLLIKLHPASLLLVSVYGLLDNFSRLAFGSLTGQYVDR
jgi:hypothetical protein